MRKGINISHVNIENMGGRDQSQVKNKSLKSSKKLSPFRKHVPKSHNDDREEPKRDGGTMPDHLCCLVKTIVGSLPIKDPHV